MADVREFSVYDAAGAPDDTLDVSSAAALVVVFKDKSGNNRSILPTFSNAGGGKYAVTVSDSDESTGCVLLIDCGAAYSPRYHSFAIHKADNSNQFWAGHTLAADGSLWTGAQSTVGSYTNSAGGGRTSPSLLTLATYLWCATPSAADIAAESVIRVDSAAGAIPSYWTGSTVPITQLGPPNIAPTPGLSPVQLAVTSLRRYLLANLPARITEVEATRYATLSSATVGPWTVTAGMSLRLGTGRGPLLIVPLTPGSNRTAQQVADDINNVAVDVSASVDGYGCLSIAADETPSATTNTPSSVVLGADTTGANLLFGWSSSGERVVLPPLRSPGTQGVCDGYRGFNPANGQSFTLVIADREVTPWPNVAQQRRRDEFNVRIQLHIYCPLLTSDHFRSQEAISSVTRVVREILAPLDGVQLGRASSGDVPIVDILSEKISGNQFAFDQKNNAPSVLCDFATMTLNVRVYQLPPTAVSN